MKTNSSNSYRRSPHFWASVKAALNGIGVTIRRERHMKIHLIMGIVVIIVGWILNLSLLEWLILLLTIQAVLVAELINTALEITVDLVTRQHRMRARLAKDIAAGAVLVSSLMAIVIGAILFYNKGIFNIGY